MGKNNHCSVVAVVDNDVDDDVGGGDDEQHIGMFEKS